MPTEIYEVVAQGARYWFLFLMALIAWRSYRWLAKDRKQRRKRARLLPDAGFVGEMVVLKGNDLLPRGDVLPVPTEGTLGYARMNDLCVPVKDVLKRQCWLSYDQEEGLLVEPCMGCRVTVDGQPRTGRRDPLYMAHGSRLTVGEAELRLRLFAGYETATNAHVQNDMDDIDKTEPPPQAAAPTPEQVALWQQQALWQYAQQQRYAEWMAAQAAAMPVAGADEAAADWPDGEEEAWEAERAAFDDEEEPDAPEWDDMPDQASAAYGSEGATETHAAMAENSPANPAPEYPAPANPARADDGQQSYPWMEEQDDDPTDAAAPPKSAYVGLDEAETAKRVFWDKYLGGGGRR